MYHHCKFIEITIFPVPDISITRYSSGGEDGYVRVHQFDQSYLDFELEY